MWPVGEMGRNRAPVLGVETVGAIETGAKEIEGTGFGLEQMQGMGRGRKPGGGQISDCPGQEALSAQRAQVMG